VSRCALRAPVNRSILLRVYDSEVTDPHILTGLQVDKDDGEAASGGPAAKRCEMGRCTCTILPQPPEPVFLNGSGIDSCWGYDRVFVVSRP
jgi:hypothetical protein